MNRATKPFETLEHRTLMSATLFSTAVTHDRAEIHADFVKLNSDLYADAKTLLTDNHALKVDHVHQNTVLQPLVATLRTDVLTFQLTLKTDRLAEAENVVADELVVVNELKQMLKDKGNATALAADKLALKADRVQLNTDEVAGLTQRLTDRQTETNTILSDSAAILIALPTSGASAQLTADVTQWLGDKNASLSKVTVDLQKISADRSQLILDLNAELS
jgi:hypothetical protein